MCENVFGTAVRNNSFVRICGSGLTSSHEPQFICLKKSFELIRIVYVGPHSFFLAGCIVVWFLLSVRLLRGKRSWKFVNGSEICWLFVSCSSFVNFTF